MLQQAVKVDLFAAKVGFAGGGGLFIFVFKRSLPDEVEYDLAALRFMFDFGEREELAAELTLKLSAIGGTQQCFGKRLAHGHEFGDRAVEKLHFAVVKLVRGVKRIADARDNIARLHMSGFVQRGKVCRTRFFIGRSLFKGFERLLEFLL